MQTGQGIRGYVVEDQGDGFDLAFFEDGVQVGGAFFPDPAGDGSAFSLAVDVGQSWGDNIGARLLN